MLHADKTHSCWGIQKKKHFYPKNVLKMTCSRWYEKQRLEDRKMHTQRCTSVAMGVANFAATIHTKVQKSRRRQSRFVLTSQVEYKLQPERKKVPQKRNIRAERSYQMIPSFTLHSHSSFWEIQLGDGPGGEKKERFLVSLRVCVCVCAWWQLMTHFTLQMALWHLDSQ